MSSDEIDPSAARPSRIRRDGRGTGVAFCGAMDSRSRKRDGGEVGLLGSSHGNLQRQISQRGGRVRVRRVRCVPGAICGQLRSQAAALAKTFGNAASAEGTGRRATASRRTNSARRDRVGIMKNGSSLFSASEPERRRWTARPKRVASGRRLHRRDEGSHDVWFSWPLGRPLMLEGDRRRRPQNKLWQSRAAQALGGPPDPLAC